MISNHLKFLVRVFLKDKFFSTLNILGLALGIAVSIILLLILQNDLTYDQYHVNHKRIYRLGSHVKATGLDMRTARSPRELNTILQDEMPEVEALVRAEAWNHVMVKYEGGSGEKAFYEENIVITDSNFFQLFTHEFVSGDPKTCLKQLHTVVLAETVAKKYFGDETALEKSLLIDNTLYKVTGVIKDQPANSHLRFDILLAQLPDRTWTQDKTKGVVKSEAFWNPDVYIYLLFPANYDPKNFIAKYPSIYNKYYKSFGDQVGGVYMPPILEPLASIHFHSDLGNDEPQGNLAYRYAFMGIGIFIIILACINYMNLSTAKSVNRAGEIAIKKTLGSSRQSLVLSFLSESIFLAFIAGILAIQLVIFILDATSFNELIGKDLSANFFNNKTLLFGSIGITLMIGILSGLYPAFYLPSVNTIKALKGAFKNQRSSQSLRKILITTQFAISIFVVTCTLLMQQQIDYVRNKELGFNKENILVLPIQDTLVQRQMTGIKNEFLQHPNITSAATSFSVPGMNIGGNTVMWAESEAGMVQQSFTLMVVGDEYFKLMGIELKQGRNFHDGPNNDTQGVYIANEAAADLMKWNKNAVGKKVRFYHEEKDGQVIGVVKNFNFSSLHNKIAPLLILKVGDEGGFLHLKVKGNDLPNTIGYIKERWEKYDPNHPFEYFFLDQRFNEQYKADEVQHKLLSALAYICIFISLLGLLGLSAFSASQRTKEIGVRKVHGATVPHIIYLLFKDIMVLVIIAAVLVVPLTYFMIDKWLSIFEYKMQVDYWMFIFVGIMALVFAFLTVAFHSLKTATTNPVKSLKYE